MAKDHHSRYSDKPLQRPLLKLPGNCHTSVAAPLLLVLRRCSSSRVLLGCFAKASLPHRLSSTGVMLRGGLFTRVLGRAACFCSTAAAAADWPLSQLHGYISDVAGKLKVPLRQK